MDVYNICMTRRNVYIADAIWERLRAVAESKGMKISELIRRAIIEFLEKEGG